MADTATRERFEGSGTAAYNDAVTEFWRVDYDKATALPNEFYTAESRAVAAGLPARRSAYGTVSTVDLYVTRVAGKPRGSNTHTWDWTVVFEPPPPLEFGIFDTTDPLARAAQYDIRWIEREEAIEKAANVAELVHGDGKGGSRAAGTVGPIVNAAGKRPDEPIMRTGRLPVAVIRKNFANLAQVMARNINYFDTTNSDTIPVTGTPSFSFGARTMEFLLTETMGQQKENGITFYPTETTILIKPTTDFTIDNVGYEYWNDTAGNWTTATDSEGNRMSEPINLKTDGDKGGDNTSTITYRHLTDSAYSGLFT